MGNETRGIFRHELWSDWTRSQKSNPIHIRHEKYIRINLNKGMNNIYDENYHNDEINPKVNYEKYLIIINWRTNAI